MADSLLMKVANVLDRTADVLDSFEAEKTAAVKAARETTMKSLTQRYTEVTGDELPSEVAEKLASADESVLGAVEKLLEKSAGSSGVESMGGSSELPDATPAPKNKKEAAEAAWNRFGNYIVS